MLPPHELKAKDFPRAIRGYSTADVDEHLRFVIEKYTELYRENDELERKLRTAQSQLDNYKNEEESIRATLVNAQKASSRIINEANERADVILRSAKLNCDRIIADFTEKIKRERDTLFVLRKTVADFKASLFAQYQTHIEYIEEIAPDAADDAIWSIPDETYTRRVVGNIKEDIASGAVAIRPIEDDINNDEVDRIISELPATALTDADVSAPQRPAESVAAPVEDAPDEPASQPMGLEEHAGNSSVSDNSFSEEPEEFNDDTDGTDANEQLPEEIPSLNDDSGTMRAYTSTGTGLPPVDYDEVDAPAEVSETNIKDTILELNRMFVENEGTDKPAASPATDEDKPDDEDDELLRMIQSVTSAAQTNRNKPDSK